MTTLGVGRLPRSALHPDERPFRCTAGAKRKAPTRAQSGTAQIAEARVRAPAAKKSTPAPSPPAAGAATPAAAALPKATAQQSVSNINKSTAATAAQLRAQMLAALRKAPEGRNRAKHIDAVQPSHAALRADGKGGGTAAGRGSEHALRRTAGGCTCLREALRFPDMVARSSLITRVHRARARNCAERG
jgi:hypothetical protein